jgi:hypothetical protein
MSGTMAFDAMRRKNQSNDANRLADITDAQEKAICE